MLPGGFYFRNASTRQVGEHTAAVCQPKCRVILVEGDPPTHPFDTYPARSMRITCGLWVRWPSPVIPSTARRTASSVVSWVTRITVFWEPDSGPAACWTID